MKSSSKTAAILLVSVVAIGATVSAQFEKTVPNPKTLPLNLDELLRPAPNPKSRPAIILRLSPTATPHALDVRISFDVLTKEHPRPVFAGHRFYTYSVPLDGSPTRIGWTDTRANSPRPSSLILQGARYFYTSETQDRLENGALSIQKLPGAPLKYRVRGVYAYFGEVFVLDQEVKLGEELEIFEAAPTA